MLISVSLILIFSFFLSACASQAPAGSSSSSLSQAPAATQAPAASGASSSPSKAPAADNNPIWIALVYPMTGNDAQYGAIEVRAHKYVIDQVNAQGGINGRQVKYQVFDDQGDPQQAANIAQKIVGDPKFVAVFGHYLSVCTLAAIPIYNDAKEILLTDSINEKISGSSPYVFRYSITDKEAGKQLVWAAIKNHPEYKKAAILYTQSDFGVGLNQIIAPALKDLGIDLVDTESYFEGQSKDYSPQLTKIKAANPDVIFLLGYYSEGATIVQQAHQLGMTQTFWGPDGLDNTGLITLGGKDVENSVYVTAYFSDQMTYPGVAETIKDYKAKTGYDLDGFAAITLDATRMLLQGIAAVGTDKTKLRDWLATQKNFVGIAGPIVFDKNNDNMRRIVVLHVVDGAFVPSKEQVSDAYFQSK